MRFSPTGGAARIGAPDDPGRMGGQQWEAPAHVFRAP